MPPYLPFIWDGTHTVSYKDGMWSWVQAIILNPFFSPKQITMFPVKIFETQGNSIRESLFTRGWVIYCSRFGPLAGGFCTICYCVFFKFHNRKSLNHLSKISVSLFPVLLFLISLLGKKKPSWEGSERVQYMYRGYSSQETPLRAPLHNLLTPLSLGHDLFFTAMLKSTFWKALRKTKGRTLVHTPC